MTSLMFFRAGQRIHPWSFSLSLLYYCLAAGLLAACALYIIIRRNFCGGRAVYYFGWWRGHRRHHTWAHIIEAKSRLAPTNFHHSKRYYKDMWIKGERREKWKGRGCWSAVAAWLNHQGGDLKLISVRVA
jgi:hypothetical protein